MGGLPGAQDHLANSAHRLRISRHHRDRSQIVKNIFRRDSFAANSRFGKSDVLGNCRIEVMANHKHVEVLVQSVHRVRPGRVSGGGQNIWFATYFDDIRGVPSTGAFGVISVDRAILKCRDGIFDETRFVQGIGMERDLSVRFFGHGETNTDRGRSCPPVLMKLEPDSARLNLLAEWLRATGIAFTQKTKIDWITLRGLEHSLDVPRSGRASRCESSGGRAGPSADHRRDTG